VKTYLIIIEGRRVMKVKPNDVKKRFDGTGGLCRRSSGNTVFLVERPRIVD